MSVRSYPPGSAYPPVQDDLDPTLQALADLTTSADTAPYFTDVDQAALMTVTTLARSLLDDTTQAEMRFTLGISDTPAAPTGTPGTVAFFGTTGALTSESALSYNAATDSLGIGTGSQSTHRLIVAAGKTVWQSGSAVGINTETTAALHVVGPGDNSNVVGEGFQAPDYRPGTANRVGFYSLVNAGTNCWGVLHNGTAASQLGGTLNVLGYTSLSTLSVNRAAPSGHDAYIGWMAADRIGAGIGNAAPGYALHVGAPAHISQLGVYYGPPGAVWFRTASAAFDSVQVGRGDAGARWPLDVAGAGHIAQLGVAYGADVAVTSGVALRASTVHFDQLGVGYTFASGLSIRAGNSHFDALGVGYVGGSGYSLRAGSTYVDSLGVGGQTTLNGQTNTTALRSSVVHVDQLGIGIAWQPGYQLYVAGAASVFQGPVGVGNVHPGYTLHVNGNVGVSSTIYTAAGLHSNGLCGFGYAPQAGYWIRAGACNLDSVTTGGLTTGGGVTIGTDLVVGNWAGKPGGGLWADSSSRTMKTAIATIDGALALLLEQQGRQYEWTDPHHRAVLPGVRYGLVLEEVTIPQWVMQRPGEQPLLSVQGFEALTIEALRELVQRLERLEQKETR